MAQRRAHASRRQFLQRGALGVIGGVFLSGCLSDELKPAGFKGAEEWSATFGGERSDSAKSVIETSDDGYLFVGWTRSFADVGDNAWVVKLNDQGSEEWSITVGGERTDLATSVIETSDGGYLFAGITWSFAGERADALLVKLNADGSEEWRNTFGEEWSDMAHSVIETSDGGYLFAGGTRSFGEAGRDAWVVKLDADGHEEWLETFGEKELDGASSVIETNDGGYLIVGSTEVLSPGVPSDAWVVKLNVDGSEQWREFFRENENSGASSVIETSDGGYLFTGHRIQDGFVEWFNDGGAWIVKLDTEGTEAWSRTFGGEYFKQDRANSVIEDSDGGYLFAGNTRSFTDEGMNAWIGKVGSDGSGRWRETFGNEGKDSVNSIIKTSDGGYLFAGQTESVDGAYWDAWVVKLALE